MNITPPKPQLPWQRWETIFLSLILSFAAYMLFKNLGNIFLWQDEAQTALISKTIFQFGVPKGYDGLNFFSQELGAEYGADYIWKWHTWLPFYVLAACYKIFGVSTFVSRLPFALAGLGCFAVLYILTRELFNDRKCALFTVVVLSLSVPFYLLSRQCRYYSFTILFSLLGLYGYILLLRGKRQGAFLYLLGATCLFHSHYVYFGTLLIVIALHTIIFHRSRWRKVLFWTVWLIVLNLPWIIWFSSMRYGEQYGGGIVDLSLIMGRFVGFLGEIQGDFQLGYWVVGLVAMVVWMKRGHCYDEQDNNIISTLALPLGFITVNVVVLSVFAPWQFFRYLSPLVPVFAMIVGFVLSRVVNLSMFLGLLIFGLSLWPCHESLKNFWYELHHDYKGPISAIVKYLESKAQQDDVVAVTYGDMPIKFYTGLRVVGGLAGDNLQKALGAEWLIIRRNTISEKDYAVRKFLIQNTDWRQYKQIILQVPDLPFENRENLGQHLFRSKTSGGRPVIIYKKIR